MHRRSVAWGAVIFLCILLAMCRTWRRYEIPLHGWDDQFYYAQGRSLLYEGTLDITDSLGMGPHQLPFDSDGDGFLEVPPRYKHHIINKYPIGLSLLEIPWMAGGYIVRILRDSLIHTPPSHAPPGYAHIEIAVVAAGLALYSTLGLVMLWHLVVSLSPGHWAAFAVLTTCMGTSLFYYTAVYPFMTHSVAFTLVVLILWQTVKLRESTTRGVFPFILLALTMGMLFLVRPQEILLLPILVPFLWQPVSSLQQRRVMWFIPLMLFFAVCSLQVFCNYFQVGSLSANAYTASNEGFNWFHPDLYIVLLSANRGLLWMNPIILLALYGLVRYWPLTWVEVAMLIHGVTQIYLIASWSSPEQGAAFGSRMWSECTPLVSFGLARFFANAARPWRLVGAMVATACTLWTMALLVLYKNGQLESLTHYDMFSKVFFKAVSLFF